MFTSLRRAAANPILTPEQIPAVSPRVADATSVFNPGAIKLGDTCVLLLRVQTRGRETVQMVAESDDGEHFRVPPTLVEIDGLDDIGSTVYHVYDARLTQIEGTLYGVFAVDTDEGCQLATARSIDLQRWELIGCGGTGDSRNGVLFSEKIGGRYLRLERPNREALATGTTTGSEIMLAESDDLKTWRLVAPVMSGRLHYWDEFVGSGPPPIKTRAGWLHVYHGVALHLSSIHIYQAGVTLLDLEDPSKVLKRGRNNILEPRTPYELVGQVGNVVFPSGIIVDEVDAAGFAKPESLVRIYYGAADTVVGVATATVAELCAACDV
jgi:predicted GH43/DUF377 family glycosyl hydrolase